MTAHRVRAAAVHLIVSATFLSGVPASGAPPSPDITNRIRGDQWHLRYLNVAKAHQLSEGEGVTVAVPDTGVDPHPDLRMNLLGGANLLPTEKGDGRNDRHGHGTGMAGLIAAHGRPGGTGALGIAPKAKILPIKMLRSDGRGDDGSLAEAINFAVASGADVISISSAGGFSAELSRALDGARSADVVIVAAAGNRPDDLGVTYPASAEGVIAVGGIAKSGIVADISATGPEVDITAPCVDIYSTSYDSLYLRGTGTSSAAAVVAGAAALLRAKFPNLSAEQVAQRLTATAIDKGPPGRDDKYGYGVIDIVAALTADVPPHGSGSSTLKSSPATAQVGPLRDDSAPTRRGLVTLSAIVAVGAVWVLIARRRRRADDPPPRISQ